MFAYCNNNPTNHSDPTGEFSWFITANAVIGAVVGAVSQVATNIMSGNDNILEGVVGAALGGATYNVVSVLTNGNIYAASAAGSAVEALTNEIGDYLTGRKELTVENVMSSAANIACKTAENTLTAAVTGKLSSKIVKINNGWFKPKKFISSFTGKYARKIWSQTAVQGSMIVVYNSTKNRANSMA